MNKTAQMVFVFFIVATSLRFFDARMIDPSLLNYIHFVSTIILVSISIPYVLTTKEGFAIPIQLIVIAIIFSIAMANFSWGQSIKETLMETYPFLTWFFFFYLIHEKVAVKHIEVIIIAFTVIYIILFSYQFTHSSTILFGKSLWGDEYTIDRGGIARIIFPGAGIFLLGIFISANKLTNRNTKSRWFWLLITLAGVAVPVLQLTREFIAGVVALYLFHFLRFFNWSNRFLVCIGLVGIALGINYAFPNIVEGLEESIRRDLGEGKNYIRVLAAEYYLTDFSPNDVSRIFGNGAPYSESLYGIYVENLETENGYYISDVGIIGVYSMFGVIAVIGYLIIWYKSFTVALPAKFQYLRYYLWYLLLTSLTWYSVYHYHYLIATVLCLYIFQRVIEKSSLQSDEES